MLLRQAVVLTLPARAPIAASGMYRPRSSPLRGTVQIISGSWGWTTSGNPKRDGRPSFMSCHVTPASSDRYAPLWFCW